MTRLCRAMSHATPGTFYHQHPLQQRVLPDSFTTSPLAAFLPGSSLEPYSGGHGTETLQCQEKRPLGLGIWGLLPKWDVPRGFGCQVVSQFGFFLQALFLDG